MRAHNLGEEYLRRRNTNEEWDLAKKQIKYILENLEFKPSKVLDLQCGFGRHSSALYNLGFDVVGVDMSDQFLEIAKRKTSKDIQYFKRDVRKKFDVGRFDLIVLMFASFGYFGYESDKKVLKNVYDSLNEEGVFVLDVADLKFFRENATRDGEELREGIYRTKYGIFNARDNVTYHDCVNRIRLKIYSEEEICTLAKDAGFSVYKKLQNYEFFWHNKIFILKKV